jgi:hypothetical protein
VKTNKFTRPVEARLEKVKGISLQDMLKNAKKVDREFVQPIKEQLLDEGIIPCPITDEYIQSVEDKALAFPRKFEASFLREYGKSYHEYRQECWKKARTYHATDSVRLHRSVLRAKAANWAFDRRFLSIGPPTEGTRMEFNFKVQLPKVYYRDVHLTLADEIRAVSGFINAIPDPYRNRELEYVRSYEGHFVPVASTELDELKHIYKTFWYAGSCSEMFLYALYEVQGSDSRVEGFWTQRRNCLDGLRRPDDTVVFSLNGKLVYISVDQLYEFIVASRRFEKRDYAYGEAYSDSFIIFAVWLWSRGISPEAIIEGLNPGLIEDALDLLDETHKRYYPPRQQRRGSDDGSEESLPSWILRVQEELRENVSSHGSEWKCKDLVRIENDLVIEAMPSFEEAIAHILEQEAGSSLASSSLVIQRSENSFISHISDSDNGNSSNHSTGDEEDDNSDVFSNVSDNTQDLIIENGFAPHEDFEHILLHDLHAYFYEDEREVRKLSAEERRRLISVMPNHWRRDNNAKYDTYISVKFGKGTFDPRQVTRKSWHALRVKQPP